MYKNPRQSSWHSIFRSLLRRELFLSLTEFLRLLALIHGPHFCAPEAKTDPGPLQQCLGLRLFLWVCRLNLGLRRDAQWREKFKRSWRTPASPVTDSVDLGPILSAARSRKEIVHEMGTQIQFSGLVESIITLSQSWFLHIFKIFYYIDNAYPFKICLCVKMFI